MDSFIEICDVKIVGKKTKIYIKGWVHSNNYSIVLKNRNNILAEFTGNESRYGCLETLLQKNGWKFFVKKQNGLASFA